MKKVILGSVLAVAAAASINANAAQSAVCTGGNAVSASVGSLASGGFVRTQFNARCSNNVMLTAGDEVTYYQVGAASVKGKNAFGASSAGGGVVGRGCSSATGCVSGDATFSATSTATS